MWNGVAPWCGKGQGLHVGSGFARAPGGGGHLRGRDEWCGVMEWGWQGVRVAWGGVEVRGGVAPWGWKGMCMWWGAAVPHPMVGLLGVGSTGQ